MFHVISWQATCLILQYKCGIILADDWPTELLQEGWKYLFEYYETFSNHDERVLIDQNKEQELNNLQNAWSDIVVSDDWFSGSSNFHTFLLALQKTRSVKIIKSNFRFYFITAELKV